ncbi:hypothetical protein LJ737_23430 [Hymenobacter sp. 15J16-1T3B]|uniref:DUF2231 domain-containing protein n=1 Tax=Hymenobacter sp. 15J16-1T3B TaxID=2886941 RepID=UPI001D0F4F98|nr:DUF2231 domain-containing protein [Hymenobacter sp. 15J16-1T3B]MCC3160208.1 hypothetical protein [Hymenobacter sp. 15J16-1T3B]
MFSDFPNLHPLVVHLPIVLLLLGAALQALRVYRDWPPVRWITIGVLAGGFLGAVAASTVFHAMPLGLAPRAAAVFEAHEKFAVYTLWLSGITLLLAGIGVFFKVQGRPYEILVLVAAVATAGVLSVAGHRGAQLVYVEGVGPQGRLLDNSHGHGGGSAMPGMEMGADEHPGNAASPTATAQTSPSAATNAPEMPGMDMRGQATPDRGNTPASAGNEMGTMDMSGTQPSDMPRAATRPAAMPGMNMPAAKGPSRMAPGMEMGGAAGQQPMGAMPGMDNMPGMRRPSSGRKSPAKASPTTGSMDDMSGMGNMPGMQAPAATHAKPAAPAMGDMRNMPGMEKGMPMPATGTMPGMDMPASPLDKYRFEDNNPARNTPQHANKNEKH